MYISLRLAAGIALANHDRRPRYNHISRWIHFVSLNRYLQSKIIFFFFTFGYICVLYIYIYMYADVICQCGASFCLWWWLYCRCKYFQFIFIHFFFPFIYIFYTFFIIVIFHFDTNEYTYRHIRLCLIFQFICRSLDIFYICDVCIRIRFLNFLNFNALRHFTSDSEKYLTFLFISIYLRVFFYFYSCKKINVYKEMKTAEYRFFFLFTLFFFFFAMSCTVWSYFLWGNNSWTYISTGFLSFLLIYICIYLCTGSADIRSLVQYSPVWDRWIDILSRE